MHFLQGRQLCYHFLLITVAVASVHADEEQLAKDLIDKSKVASDKFGNLHVRVFHESKLGAESHKKEIEFWSREGVYFRQDSTVIESTSANLVGSRERLIVRPEGFVMLSSPNQERPLAIVNYGSNKEGLDRVKGGLIFEAATRLTSVVSIRDYLQNRLDAKDQFEKEFALSLKSNGGNILFSLDWSKGENKSNFRAEFDKASGYCKNSINTVTSGSQPPYEWAVDKQYENGIVVPLLHTEKRSQSGTVVVQHIVKRSFFEDGPAPIGVFSLDAQGVSQGNVWLRRMIMLAVGIVVLGCFFLYRKMKKHA